MSQIQSLFPAGAKVTPFSAATTAPVPVVLACGGSTLRVVNEGTVGAFIAVGDSATDPYAIATLPVAGLTTSCYVGPGADFTISIPGNPGDAAKFASGITRTGTAQLQFYVGSGS